jgi:hypothetical protein
MSEITWDPDKGPSDDQVDEAMRVLRAEYWHSIRSNAKGLADEIRKGDLAPEDVNDRLHEDADGSYWTIYTRANYRAIMCSDESPFALAEDAGVSCDPSDVETLSRLAYLVVKHDTREQLEAELGCAPEDWTAESEGESR